MIKGMKFILFLIFRDVKIHNKIIIKKIINCEDILAPLVKNMILSVNYKTQSCQY